MLFWKVNENLNLSSFNEILKDLTGSVIAIFIAIFYCLTYNEHNVIVVCKNYYIGNYLKMSIFFITSHITLCTFYL